MTPNLVEAGPVAAGVTVIIPTHNRSAQLQEAVRSVLASPLIPDPASVIVVDDDSSDDTAAVVRALGTRYVRITGGNPSAARNAGLSLVPTEFVTFLDDDDRWRPGNIEPQLAALDATPAAGFAFARAQLTDQSWRPGGVPFPAPPLPQGMAPGFIFRAEPQLGTVLFRLAAVLDAGGFDERLRYCEDTDLLTRIAVTRPVIGLDLVGMDFRQRAVSVADADVVGATYRDYRVSLRTARDLGALGWFEALRADFAVRGRFAYELTEAASFAFAQDARRNAARYLALALWMSPPHALLRQPRFWSTLRSLLGSRRPSRREVGANSR